MAIVSRAGRATHVLPWLGGLTAGRVSPCPWPPPPLSSLPPLITILPVLCLPSPHPRLCAQPRPGELFVAFALTNFSSSVCWPLHAASSLSCPTPVWITSDPCLPRVNHFVVSASMTYNFSHAGDHFAAREISSGIFVVTVACSSVAAELLRRGGCSLGELRFRLHPSLDAASQRADF